MKKVILILLFLSFSAAAQDAKQCVAETKDPLRCLVSNSSAYLYTCALSMELALLNGGADIQCGMDLKRKMAPFYAEAKKSAVKNKETTALLKDYYATWEATLDGLLPGDGETKGAYKRRIEASRRALNEKGNRLQLEN